SRPWRTSCRGRRTWERKPAAPRRSEDASRASRMARSTDAPPERATPAGHGPRADGCGRGPGAARERVRTRSCGRTTVSAGLRPRPLAIAAHKGGVGKTTTAMAASAALARGGHGPVLLVDLDPQGHSTLGLGLDVDDE